MLRVVRRLHAIVRQRWTRLPGWARWALAVYVIGFADGTIDHVMWMRRGGIHAYAGFGYVPVQVFLVLLVILDPFALLLCALVRRAGVWLGVLIMALDVPANWAGNWNAMPRFVVTFLLGELFAVFVFATAVPMLSAIGSVDEVRSHLTR
jgi:hypothetical protein